MTGRRTTLPSFDDLVREAAARRSTDARLTPEWCTAVGRVCGARLEEELLERGGSAAATAAAAAGKKAGAAAAATAVAVAALGPFGILATGLVAGTVAAMATASSRKADQVARHVNDLDRARGLYGEVRDLPASPQKDNLLRMIVDDLASG